MKNFDRLKEIVARLRDRENGCPWDIKQTPKSLVPNFIEEVYEAVEAIENNDPNHLKEELGDVLLHVVMQGQIAQEDNAFTIEDSLDHICNKLVHRHPHVFGQTDAIDADEVKLNWERIKQKEKAHRKSAIDGIPLSMPALIVAWRMQEKAASVNFDWKTPEPIMAKLEEETKEFLEAVASKDKDEMENEIGDLLFTIVNLARHYKIDAEAALRRTIDKFSRRFRQVEQLVKQQGKQTYECSLEELDALWEVAKKSEK